MRPARPQATGTLAAIIALRINDTAKLKLLSMNKQSITINGDHFTDLESFYNEIDRVLTKNLDWKTGHNLDAFNDLLRGGFGVYENEEPVKLNWTIFANSRKQLGQVLIDKLIEIIKHHDRIKFSTTE